MKLKWYTLSEIAEKEGLSRRRVQQKVDKGLYDNVRQVPINKFRHEIGLPETKE